MLFPPLVFTTFINGLYSHSDWAPPASGHQENTSFHNTLLNSFPWKSSLTTGGNSPWQRLRTRSRGHSLLAGCYKHTASSVPTDRQYLNPGFLAVCGSISRVLQTKHCRMSCLPLTSCIMHIMWYIRSRKSKQHWSWALPVLVIYEYFLFHIYGPRASI